MLLLLLYTSLWRESADHNLEGKMVVRNGSLAGHAGAHANNIDTFAFLQKKPGLCSKYTHKNCKLADIVQRLFVLNYVFALLLLSVRSCHSGQQQQQQSGCERDARHGFNLNPWSQYVVYAKILNNGRATQPPTWTNTRGAENLKQPHRKIIYLMAILLLAGDVQLNPGPRLASAGDLLPSLGALDFPPALAMPPSASGGVYGGCLLRRGDSGGEWSGLAGERRSRHGAFLWCQCAVCCACFGCCGCGCRGLASSAVWRALLSTNIR